VNIHNEIIEELTVLKVKSKLTTKEIAIKSNISRPVVTKLLNEGKGKIVFYGKLRDFLKKYINDKGVN
jgi:DNA-binding transcriptional regulator LsrR (DeoR family)